MSRAWKPRNAKLYSEIAEASRVIGCSRGALAKWMRDPTFPWTDAKAKTFTIPAVLYWKYHADRPTETSDQEADPLLATGGSSPALERYRDEKARLANLDRREREGDLVSREAVREVVTRLLHAVAEGFEQLQHTFGPGMAVELTAIVNNAVDEVHRFLDGLVEAV